jgi:hypothetical protein
MLHRKQAAQSARSQGPNGLNIVSRCFAWKADAQLQRDTARAMSEENVERARQVLDAVGRRNLARLVGLTDKEVEWRSDS